MCPSDTLIKSSCHVQFIFVFTALSWVKFECIKYWNLNDAKVITFKMYHIAVNACGNETTQILLVVKELDVFNISFSKFEIWFVFTQIQNVEFHIFNLVFSQNYWLFVLKYNSNTFMISFESHKLLDKSTTQISASQPFFASRHSCSTKTLFGSTPRCKIGIQAN